MHRKPITTPGFEATLRAYLDDPTEAHWRLLATRIVPGTLRSVWQAWARVDRAAPLKLPRGGAWPLLPDPFTVRRAIRAARAGQVPAGLNALCAVRDPAVPRGDNNNRGDGT